MCCIAVDVREYVTGTVVPPIWSILKNCDLTYRYGAQNDL